MVPAIVHDIANSVRSLEYVNELAKQAGVMLVSLPPNCWAVRANTG